MEKIYKQLKNNEITELDLWATLNVEEYGNEHIYHHYKIYQKEINKLSEYLKYNSSLTSLNLECIDIENIDIIGESLKYNNKLNKLRLNSNKIKDINK